MSENFNTDNRFNYVANTYKAYGNNGNCFDKSVNDAGCTGTFSQTLRNNLYNMSDHLPVVMQFNINENLSTQNQVLNPAIWFQTSNVQAKEIVLGIESTKINHQTKLYLYNTLGQLLQTIPINSQPTITINIEKLSKGLYFIKPSNNAPVLKFIKQ